MKIKLSRIFIFLLILHTILYQNTITYASDDKSVKISSKYAIVVDIDTGEVIYSLNADSKTQNASTTKLLTALILSENRQKSDYIQMTAGAKALPSSSIVKDKLPGMPVGEKISADNVMKGLLLSSGNDMAEIIAENISGSVDSFSDKMNQKAKELGMNNTKFYTPNGLDADTYLDGHDHYSTAYDLSLLGIEAYKNSWIRETMATENFNFQTGNGLSCQIKNTNSNLNKNGCTGGKTGYTDKAGRCLVAFYNKNGKNLVGVVLCGENHIFFNDMDNIINYSTEKKKETLISNSKELKKISVDYKPSKYTNKTIKYDIPIFIKEDISGYKNDFNDNHTDINYNISTNIDTQNLDENTVIGTLDYVVNGKIHTCNLYTSASTSEFANDNKAYIDKINRNVMIIKIALSFLIIILLLIIIKNKKRRKRKAKKKAKRKRTNSNFDIKKVQEFKKRKKNNS